MGHNQKEKYFDVVKVEEGVINVIIPSLFNDKERGAILNIILQKRATIEEVSVNTEKNLVEIKFNSKELSKNELFDVLVIVLANFSEKPIEKENLDEPLVVNKNSSMQRVVFSVEGMSCPSCALYLQMTLIRDKRVMNANVDYKSTKGMVVGFLDLGDVATIIVEHGYKMNVGQGLQS